MTPLSGWKSSEFWLSVAAAILGALPAVLTGVNPALGAAAAALAAVYTLARTSLKSKHLDLAAAAPVVQQVAAAVEQVKGAAAPAALPAFGGMTSAEKVAAKEVADPAQLAALQAAADAAAAALVKAQAELLAAQAGTAAHS